jgi:hypothetical protein
MTKTKTAVAERSTLATRPAVSRKLLARKASDAASPAAPHDNPIEDSFPEAAADATAGGIAAIGGAERQDTAAAEVVSGDAPEGLAGASTEPLPPSGAVQPAQQSGWSSDDEAALQALLARRKAAGFQRRGRDVGAQTISPGSIKPNEGTVVATIVALVVSRESIGRSELIDLMTVTAFPNAKARAGDRGWCQGYVAGAIRDGYLAADAPAAAKAA